MQRTQREAQRKPRTGSTEGAENAEKRTGVDHFPHSLCNTSADTLRPHITIMAFWPCQRDASWRNAATATPAAPSITQCSVSRISRMARSVSSSETSTARPITRRQTSKVTEPGSSPPAVLSDSVGRSATFTIRPAFRHSCITGEFSGQHPTISVWGDTALRYSPMPPISPPPPTATNTASICGNWRSEEHTSELQSLTNLVCRLLLEKKN